MRDNKDFVIRDGVLVDYRGESEEIVIPEGVTQISFHFCSHHKKVRRIELPQSLTSITQVNFCDFASLELIRIPKSVKCIERFAFSGCLNLSKVDFENEDVEIETGAFDGTKWQADMLKETGMFVAGKYLVTVSAEATAISIPPQVKIIGRDAFRKSTIRHLVVPEGVEEIDICAFYNCPIESISLPDSLRRIGALAFSGCTNLKELKIPKGVKYIGENACNHMPNCVVSILNPEDDEDEAYTACWIGNGGAKSVRVPFGSEAMRSTMLSNVRYTLLPGEAQKYTYIDRYFCCEGNVLIKYLGKQEIVRVPSGIEVIANNAFTSSKMKRVYLPSSVTHIEECAFAECDQLERVRGSHVRKVDEYAFLGCEKLKTVSFPQLEKYVDLTFTRCNSLKPENMFFSPNTVAIRTHITHCSCCSHKLPKGKIHTKASVIIE